MPVMKFATLIVLGMAAAPGLVSAQSTTMPATAMPITTAQAGAPLSTSPNSTRSSNIVPENTLSNVAPNLPASPAGENAAVQEYLRSARASLAAGRTGEAQQSLEMAATRALTRSVDTQQITAPDSNPMVLRIRDALHALGTGNRTQAMDLIDGGLVN